MDNFYTRHKLARSISKSTDNKVKVIGTVRDNFIDTANKDNVLKAIAYLKDKPGHSWCVVRAVEESKTPPLKKQKIQSNTMDRYLTQISLSKMVTTIASKAGYIIWKDKKIIRFYTNDLTLTPTSDILYGHSVKVVMAGHGLAPLKRWTGK